MKKMVFLAVVVGWLPLLLQVYPANAQNIVPGCPGCMPRAGQKLDSTNVTPAPSFQTNANTGNVHIPPRTIETVVNIPPPPPPPPVANDPYTFTAAFLNCNITGSKGEPAIAAAISAGYKAGGRCADDQYTWWQAQFSTHLHSVYDSSKGSTTYVTNDIPANVVNSNYGNWPGRNTLATRLASSGDMDAPADPATGSLGGMNTRCKAQARSSGYLSPSSYRYYRGPNSATCGK